ncbi:MAG: DUF4878 domain-containing protein [Cyclobacteriaceae bacterium]|nr:DUF4878 domain-containing protein [Cyclobacteriaceae bacterium]MDW8330796.1 DUF4878 domain-containing protein [Cyclobacteriaceae bacterium]
MKQLSLIILVAFTVILTGCKSSPEDVVSSFFEAVDKGDVTKAKKYLSKDLISKLGETKLTIALSEQIEKFKECGGVKEIKVNLEGQGGIRNGTAKISFNGKCPDTTEKVSLILEDGNWKITMSKD